MNVSRYGFLGLTAAIMSLALPAVAQPDTVKLKGVSLGMTIEQARDILEADGYGVRIEAVTFDVAPDDPVRVGLYAQKLNPGESQDSITIRTSEHPTEARVAVIHRDLRYQRRDIGPIADVYSDALVNLVGGTPSLDRLRPLPTSAQTVQEIGFEWGRNGNLKTPGLLHRLAGTERPLCVQAVNMARNNIVSFRTRHKAATPYRLDSNGRYNSNRPGTYARECNVSMYAQAIFDNATEVVQSFQQTLVDHTTLARDSDTLDVWLREKQIETNANRSRDRVPDL